MVTVAYISRIIFRLLAYPFLAYIATIYYHAKLHNPESMDSLKRAFVVPEILDCFGGEALNPAQIVEPVEPDLEIEIEIGDQIAPPKPKEVKLTAQGLDVDLKEQRQVLFELAMQCHQLEAQADILEKERPKGKRLTKLQSDNINISKCYQDFPYHERIHNYTMANYAKSLNVIILKTSEKIDNSIRSLEAVNNWNNIAKRLTDFVKTCGVGCKPLAVAVHGYYPVDQDEIDALKEGYSLAIANLKSLFTSKLALNNDNIKKLRIKADDNNILPPPPTSSLITINNQALKLLNDNFVYFKESGAIKNEHIDKSALANLSHVNNITIN